MTNLTANTIEHSIRNNMLLKHGSPQFLDKLCENSHTFQAPKNHMFFLREQQAEHFYIVLHGWVKLFRESIDGNQAIIDVLTSGHIFGESALFENMIFPYSAEAVESMQLIRLPLLSLKNEIETNPKMSLAMLKTMSKHKSQKNMELEHRTLQNAPQRIGCFLLTLLPKPESKEAQDIQLPYDKTLVSSRLGMQPETFSRALSKLKKEVNLEVKGGTITVTNVEKLTLFCCSACSTIFPCGDH